MSGATAQPLRFLREDSPCPRLGRERVRELLTPRSVAIVGARDAALWSRMTFDSCMRFGFDGPLHLVNRRGERAHGRATVRTLAEIGEPVDLAILLVPNAAVPDALRDAAAAGVRGVVLLGAGYAELGAEGAAAQRELAELAAELDIAVVGPNGLGFANLVDRAPGWTAMPPDPLIVGSVALVSQSGNIMITGSNFAARSGVGVSHMVGTGNELTLDVLDVLDCLVEDERVKVLAVFAESIRDAGFFREIAARAAELRKPIVMLKIGASELAAQVAQTHTGALVGDDDVVDAVLRAEGVVRVSSVEQLVLTSALLAHTGELPPGGLAVASISGGINDIIADRAEALGVPLPTFAPQTRARLQANMSELATAQNPFDFTGGAMGREEWQTEPLRAMLDDPEVAMLAYTGVPFLETEPGAVAESFGGIGQGMREAGPQGVFLVNAVGPVSTAQRESLEEAGIGLTLPGVEYGLQAIGHAMWWSQRMRERRPAPPPVAPLELDAQACTGSWSEARALELLEAHGVPVVPWRLADSAAAVVAAARAIGYPVVVKVVSDEILHKSDVGGVVLDVRDDDAARAAFARVREAAERAGAPFDGALVAALRGGGLELLAGVVRDPQWGLTLAVALGGVQVEVLGDRALRVLPVDEAEVRAMLGELQAAPLLDGFRGTPAADLECLSRAIAAFARLAESLGPQLVSMEVNPLRVHGAEVEALDAAISWRAV